VAPLAHLWLRLWARSQVLRFEGAKYIFRGHDFCFYYIFKTNVSGNKKIWGSQKKFGGAVPTKAPPWLRACSKL